MHDHAKRPLILDGRRNVFEAGSGIAGEASVLDRAILLLNLFLHARVARAGGRGAARHARLWLLAASSARHRLKPLVLAPTFLEKGGATLPRACGGYNRFFSHTLQTFRSSWHLPPAGFHPGTRVSCSVTSGGRTGRKPLCHTTASPTPRG